MDKDTVAIARANVLGVGVSAVDMDSAVQHLLDVRRKGGRGYVCVTSVHGVIESQRDETLRLIHNQSLLTVPDGMPNVWMGREQGFVHMGRVYGPDLMLRLCEATVSVDECSLMIDKKKHHDPSSEPPTEQQDDSNYLYPSQDETGSLDLGNGQRSQGDFPSTGNSQRSTKQMSFTHFLYGSTPEVLEKLQANLEKKFPGIRIVGQYAPPFRPLNEEEEAELQQIVADCAPDILWVGLSTPKQERFMAAHALEGGPYPLSCGIMLGVGAAFDIHAGLLKDAPNWIKNSGLQWLHRLCMEPRRLWRRYLDIVPKFLCLTALQLLGVRKYEVSHGIQ